MVWPGSRNQAGGLHVVKLLPSRTRLGTAGVSLAYDYQARPGPGRPGSIYPAVQNILLAARGLGLGCCLTTRQTRFEEDIKQLLNIPEDVATAALLPLGFPAEGVGYGPTRRRALEEVAFDG